jgi:hypothetical protein
VLGVLRFVCSCTLTFPLELKRWLEVEERERRLPSLAICFIEMTAREK